MSGFSLRFDLLNWEIAAFAALILGGLVLLIGSWHALSSLKRVALAAVLSGALMVCVVQTLTGGGGAGAGSDRIIKQHSVRNGGTASARAGSPGRGAGGRGSMTDHEAAAGSGAADNSGLLGRMAGVMTGNAYASAAGTGARKFQDCAVCPVMRLIAPGYVELGAARLSDASGGPMGLTARIDYHYAISVNEVSVREWHAFVVATGGKLPSCRSSGRNPGELIIEPVTCITQDDAVRYVRWLSQVTGERYRLVSEAEWEHAARAGATRVYWSGLLPPLTVDGVIPANGNGLRGLHNRIGERVADCWSNALQGDVTSGAPFLRSNCELSVVKDFDAAGGRAGLAARLPMALGARNDRVGLRVVRAVK